MNKSASLVSEGIAQRIHLVRGHKVMLDADLAYLYNVETRVLVQAGSNAIPGVFRPISCSS